MMIEKLDHARSLLAKIKEDGLQELDYTLLPAMIQELVEAVEALTDAITAHIDPSAVNSACRTAPDNSRDSRSSGRRLCGAELRLSHAESLKR